MVTRPTGATEGMEDMDMARDLLSLSLGMDTLLVMDIQATGVTEDTEATHMEPLTDLMEVVDTDTMDNGAALHSQSSYCNNIACCLHWKLF